VVGAVHDGSRVLGARQFDERQAVELRRLAGDRHSCVHDQLVVPSSSFHLIMR
jgi:hypothetical protein